MGKRPDSLRSLNFKNESMKDFGALALTFPVLLRASEQEDNLKTWPYMSHFHFVSFKQIDQPNNLQDKQSSTKKIPTQHYDYKAFGLA